VADIISVDPDVVAYHAGRVERVAGDAHLAVSAAQSMHVGNGAFGLLCMFLVGPAMVTTAAATEALVSVERLITRSGTVLREGVSDFAGHEDRVVDSVRGVQTDVDGAR
jgi:class 3 adenylate cyclase